MKSLLFPIVLFTCYFIYGINNDHGIDKHIWALLLCSFALIYNIMEEYAWRGYLLEGLGGDKLCSKKHYFMSILVLLAFIDFQQLRSIWGLLDFLCFLYYLFFHSDICLFTNKIYNRCSISSYFYCLDKYCCFSLLYPIHVIIINMEQKAN